MGQRLGRGFDAEEVVPAIEQLVQTYFSLRESEAETFLQVVERAGTQPFKDALYPAKEPADAG